MECVKIRENLSAYVDSMLSPEERALIDHHIKSCSECATSLADTKKTIEHAKNLEAVEPPYWLTQKIMAKVREEAQLKKGLFQKLFYPLHIKVPVGAVATIAIALTTLYIFRTIEPEIKLAKAPTEEAAPQVPEKEQQPPQRDAEAEKAPSVFSPLPKGGEGRFEEKKAVSPKPAEQVVPSKEMRALGDKFEAPKVPEPMKQAELSQEQRAAAPASGKDASTPSVGALAKEEAKREAAPAAPRMKSMAEERKESIRVTVHVKDVGSAQKEIERHISELGGKVVKEESYENKYIFTADIDSEKLKEFVERLKSVGQVKEKDIDFEGAKEEVGIRIEIMSIP